MDVVTMHAPDTDRVRANTWPAVNERIDRLAQLRIRQAAGSGGGVERRLQRLDGEWDIERVLEAEVALTGLAGLALGAFVDRRLLAMPAFAAAMLLVHASHGWYPLLPLFRRLGLRTEDEIERERYALKAVAGHFDDVPAPGGKGGTRAARAWKAVCV